MTIQQTVIAAFEQQFGETIAKIATDFGVTYNLAFANGGDQNNEICPERDICNKHGIQLIDDLGKKIQSSSWLLKK